MILLLLKIISGRNFCLLFNTSKDFSNYRHSVNVWSFNKMFRDSGFKRDDILVLHSEDHIKDVRNIKPNKVYHDSEYFFELNEESSSKNNNKNIPNAKSNKIDYGHSNKNITKRKVLEKETITINLFLNIIRCNNVKMRDLDESSNVFIYICGHGGDGFIKFYDRVDLLYGDLAAGLKYLSKRVRKVCIILDTCQSESFIINNIMPQNCLVIATSALGKPSVSRSVNHDIGCAVIDTFPKFFYDKFYKLESLDVTFSDFLEDFSFENLGSDLKTTQNSSEFYIEEFFTTNSEVYLEKFKFL